MELIQSPKIDFIRHKYPDWFMMTCRTLHRLVKSVFGALDQLHGSFSDICAHQDLQKPNFVMPELLIKELGLS